MRRRRLRKTPAHLEITAFINLIVVLVPFLLSTAVFSRLAVMDLNLPAQQAAVEQLKVADLQLEVVLRHDAIEPQTPYDHLVQAMDAVRSSVRPDGAKLVRAELFPHISIGDAPVRRDAAARLAVPPARGAS